MNAWIRSILMPVQGTPTRAGWTPLPVSDLPVAPSSSCWWRACGGFLFRYRRRGPDDVTPHITHHFKLEVAWTLIPLRHRDGASSFGAFIATWTHREPGGRLEIQVTAKKWLWQFEYPNGIRTINEMHVPLGKPVKLVMTSEDVIHGFFVPTFRIKQDVLSRTRYTQLWFQATVPGMHQLDCTQYCGQGHSTCWRRSSWTTRRSTTTGSRPAATRARTCRCPVSGACSMPAAAARPATRSTACAARAPASRASGATGRTHRRQVRHGGRELRPRVDPVAAGEDREPASSPSCPPSRACCGSGRSRR